MNYLTKIAVLHPSSSSVTLQHLICDFTMLVCNDFLKIPPFFFWYICQCKSFWNKSLIQSQNASPFKVKFFFLPTNKRQLSVLQWNRWKRTTRKMRTTSTTCSSSSTKHMCWQPSRLPRPLSSSLTWWRIPAIHLDRMLPMEAPVTLTICGLHFLIFSFDIFQSKSTQF